MAFGEMKPTFPLDDREIQKKSTRTVLGSLLTWAAWLPTVGLWSVMEVANWMWLPVGLVTGGALWWYWRNQLQKLRPQWKLDQIQQSNKAQDSLLEQEQQRLRSQGAKWESQVLRQVRQDKSAIEQSLLEKQPDFALWQRLEVLIDTLAFSLIDKLGQHVQSPEATLKTQIEDAAAQLSQTRQDLPAIISPTRGAQQDAMTQQDQLTAALDGLREEREIAQRVRQRLESGFSETTYSGGSPTNLSE